ncbi:hypothetical protein QR680_008304 [Steinernema hermaphroditum]|uniref:Granulins domain-containing protein n=1 Tax=Steinernema hermaphroditum TaxID=289476 RepID=A0AA39M7V6_9BILA|nr:hypothetical protein QR680_008304 [Steinernema hermaphroditum]
MKAFIILILIGTFVSNISAVCQVGQTECRGCAGGKCCPIACGHCCLSGLRCCPCGLVCDTTETFCMRPGMNGANMTMTNIRTL